MKTEVIRVTFPEPVTVNNGEILQIKFVQDLITGEIKNIKTKVFSKEEKMDQDTEQHFDNERPVEDVYILGTFDGQSKFNFIDSDNAVQSVTVPGMAVHTINMTYGSTDEPTIYQRAIPARGCHVPEMNLWIVNYHARSYKIAESNVYFPQLEITSQPGESIHQIGNLSTLTHIDADSQRVNYSTGAQRSAAVEHLRYDLIHPIFAQVLAEVLAEGAAKYGEHNWELGFPVQTLFNHHLAHVFDYMGGDRSEDHMGHAACNIMFLVVELRLREKMHAGHLRLPGSQLSPEMIQIIKDFQAEKERKQAEFNFYLGSIKKLIDEKILIETESDRDLPLKELIEHHFPKASEYTLYEVFRKLKIDTTDGFIKGYILANTVPKDSEEQINLILLDLYQCGELRYSAGSSFDVKKLLRHHFNKFSYNNTIRIMRKGGMLIDEGGNLKDIDWRQLGK